MRKKDQELVAEILGDYESRKEVRRPTEYAWTLGLNYFCGNQYAEIAQNGAVTESVSDYPWQTKEVYNHIAPIVETRLAKFSGLAASVSVRPSTSDESDINAAKFATKLLRSAEEQSDLKSKIREATFWAEVCGTAFYKVDWDDKAGRRVSADRYEGDVSVEVISPYEIFPDDLSARDFSDCRSVIRAKAYPVEAILEEYGERVTPSDVEVVGSFGPFDKFVQNPAVRSGYAVVVERYVAPTASRQNGRLTVVCGDKLLFDGDLPTLCQETGSPYPFVRQVCLERPSGFFGGSIIDRLIPIQRAYNAVKCRKHEYMNRMAMGILMVEDGSVDLPDLEEEGLAPGKIVVYRQGSNPPVMLNMGGVPNDFAEEEAKLLAEFVSVSGVSDFLTSSTFKATNLSGVALNLIIEQDNNRLSVTTNSIRRAVKEVGKKILHLYKNYAKNKRLVRISGENGEIELRYFTGNDITADDLCFDVENESVGSSAARKSMVEELIKLGVFFDETGKLSAETRLKIMEIMGLGNWEHALSDEDLHEKKAEKENERLMKEDLEPDENDAHELHIATHVRRLVTLDAEDPGAERLKDHIRRHKTLSAMVREADRLNA
ncbi:MAG: hypothetical protein IJ735_00560 [Clostridia bacterium]|nr:hypothetical protein [Clostridia bacterium]